MFRTLTTNLCNNNSISGLLKVSEDISKRDRRGGKRRKNTFQNSKNNNKPE